MSRDEVRAFDAWAVNELGIAGVVLMENAGRSCAEHIIKELDSRPCLKHAGVTILRGNDKEEQLEGNLESVVCIFCGTGNNGGDGFVIARHLHNKGYTVNVVICGDPEKIKGDAKANYDLWLGLKQQVLVITFESNISEQVKDFCSGAAIIVDAIFGTGLSGGLRDNYKVLIDSINEQNLPVVAVDIPSGLNCDTGEALGTAVRAKSTVTFVAMKKGFAENQRSLEYTGQIEIASIGVEPSAMSV